MRALLPLAAALLLAAVPPASAQVEAEASLTIEGLAGTTTNATSAALPFTVRFDLENFPCLGQGATMTVALAATADGNATATVTPAEMTFVVPLNAGVTGYSHTQGGTILVARPDTSATNASVLLTVAMTEVEGCAAASVQGFEANAGAAVAFQPLAGAAAEPGPAMPAPGLALGALVLAAAALILRRRA